MPVMQSVRKKDTHQKLIKDLIMSKLNMFRQITLYGVIIVLTFGCSKQPSAPKDNSVKTSVFTTLPPLGNLIEEIGREYIDVKTLINSNQDPHLFEPSPRQVVSLGKAQAYFTTGLPVESSLKSKFENNETISFKDITGGVRFRSLGEHSHEHAHTSSCGGHIDPHIWLGHQQLMVIAKNICEQLIELQPEFRGEFTRNLQAFIVDIEKIHSNTKALLAPHRGKSITVFHPSFGYFTDTYGLVQNAIEFEGKNPTPKRFSELVAKSKQNNTRVLFIQPQFNQSTAEAIAQSIGAEVCQLNALAPDVKRNLVEIAEKIAGALHKDLK